MMNNITKIFTLLSFLSILACGSEPQLENVAPEAVTENLSQTELEIRSLDAQIEKEPKNAKLYELRGDSFFKLDGYDEAINDYTNAMELDQKNPIYPQKLAAVYMNYNRSRKAYNIMTAASFKFPQDTSLLLKLAEYEVLLKKNNEAFQTLQKVLKIDRHRAEAYFLMGLNFKDTGEMDKAINSFQTAVDKDSDYVEALMMLGYIYDEKNDPIAVRFFDNAIASEPNYMDAYLAKGNHFGNMGEFLKAIEVFKQINEKDGQNPDAYYNIGLAYMQIDSFKLASDNFKICTQLEPTYVKGHYYMGLASEKLGNKEQAKQYYQQAINLDPKMERAKQALQGL